MRGLDLQGPGSLQSRLYAALRGAIQDGRLHAGARLPSTRGLAMDLGISRNTVLAAFAMLEEEGFVATRRGSGTRVASTLPVRPIASAPSRPARRSRVRLSRFGRRLGGEGIGNPYAAMLAHRPLPFDFVYGIPPVQDLPHDVWRRLVTRVARRRPLLSFMYGPAEGSPALREAIAAHLAKVRGIRCRAEDVIVVGGFQGAVDLASRLLLDPGDRVVVEEAHYLGARAAFLAAGARLYAVPVDGEGLRTDLLPRGAARLAYVTPSHQFPTGAVMSLPRRRELLAWAERAGAVVLEDDYDTEYRYEGRPLPSLGGVDGGGRVIYAGTFSKVLFPALRLGYLLVPAAVRDLFRTCHWLAGWGAPPFEQEVLAAFMTEGHFERHLLTSRRRNAERREALLDALHSRLGDRVVVAGADAGLHVLAWLPGLRGTFETLAAKARAVGVGIYPVAPYYMTLPEAQGILLGYGAMGPRDLREGVARLASVLDDAPRDEPGRTGRRSAAALSPSRRPPLRPRVEPRVEGRVVR